MTTTETLNKLRALRLDPQARDMGISGWTCEFWVHGVLKTSSGGNEDAAVQCAWEWVQANPIEGDDWGAG